VSGEHSYTVKVYRVDGQELFEDSWSGGISIITDSNTSRVEVVSVECPREVSIPGELWCSVIVNNSLSNRIDVENPTSLKFQ